MAWRATQVLAGEAAQLRQGDQRRVRDYTKSFFTESRIIPWKGTERNGTSVPRGAQQPGLAERVYCYVIPVRNKSMRTVNSSMMCAPGDTKEVGGGGSRITTASRKLSHSIRQQPSTRLDDIHCNRMTPCGRSPVSLSAQPGDPNRLIRMALHS